MSAEMEDVDLTREVDEVYVELDKFLNSVDEEEKLKVSTVWYFNFVRSFWFTPFLLMNLVVFWRSFVVLLKRWD